MRAPTGPARAVTGWSVVHGARHRRPPLPLAASYGAPHTAPDARVAPACPPPAPALLPPHTLPPDSPYYVDVAADVDGVLAVTSRLLAGLEAEAVEAAGAPLLPEAGAPRSRPPQTPPPITHAIGLDCEWKPERVRGVRSPVATLQAACAGAAFVLDVQALAAAAPAAGPLTPAEAALNALLTSIFTHPSVAVVGHSLGQDLRKLAATLPRLPVFGGGGGAPAPLAAHVDVVCLARAAAARAAGWEGVGEAARRGEAAGGEGAEGGGEAAGDEGAEGGGQAAGTAARARPPPPCLPLPPLPHRASLAALTVAVLGRRLDKGPRTSDWAARPLSHAQLAYAAADAHVCVALFEALTASRPELLTDRAWRAHLANGVTDAVGGRSGWAGERPVWRERGRRGGGGRATSPSAPAPSSRPPPLPPATALATDAAAVVAAWLGTPLPVGGRGAAVRAAAGLPPAGPPPRHARGGVVPLANAVLLFMNFDAGGVGGPYPNAFFRGPAGELRVSWFPAPGQGPGHPVVRRLLEEGGGRGGVGGGTPPTPALPPPAVLLFARLRARPSGPYVLLGRVDDSVASWGGADDGGVSMVAWRLADANAAVDRGGEAVAALLEAGAPSERQLAWFTGVLRGR